MSKTAALLRPLGFEELAYHTSRPPTVSDIALATSKALCEGGNSKRTINIAAASYVALSGAQYGSSGRTRTCDPTINSRLLYQLSYRGISNDQKQRLSHLAHYVWPASHSSKSEGWWAVQDSNLRPPVCKTDALPTELTAHKFHVLNCKEKIRASQK